MNGRRQVWSGQGFILGTYCGAADGAKLRLPVFGAAYSQPAATIRPLGTAHSCPGGRLDPCGGVLPRRYGGTVDFCGLRV